MVLITPSKWDIPNFEVQESKVRLHKYERYFNHYRAVENLEIEAITLYLNALVETWYHSLVLSRSVVTWSNFKAESCCRFDIESLEVI